jgi:hypothetical protein
MKREVIEKFDLMFYSISITCKLGKNTLFVKAVI